MNLKDCHTLGEIVSYFLDRANLKDWQPGIVSRSIILTQMEKAFEFILKLKNNSSNGI